MLSFNPFKRKIKSNSPKSRKQQKRDKMWLWIFKCILSLVVTFIIVYAMPRTDRFNYQYKVGEPWPYRTLLATQKFSVELDSTSIQTKLDSVSRTFQPYFNHNTTVKASVLRKLKKLNLDHMNDSTVTFWQDFKRTRYEEHVTTLLDSIYAHGVMSPAMHDSLVRHGTTSIRIIDGNTAVSRPLKSVFTTLTAYSYIINSYSPHFKTEILKTFNLNTILREDLTYDVVKSQQEHEAMLGEIDTGAGIVSAGEQIVYQGEMVTPAVDQKLKAYRTIMNDQAQQNDKDRYILIGRFVLVFIIVSLLIAYLTLFRNDYIDNLRSTILLFTLLTLIVVFGCLMVGHHLFHIFALPCCMLPIIVRVFLDSRTAFIFHTGTVLIISLTLSYPYEFLILQLITGIIAIQNLRELSQRSQIIHTAAVITLFALLSHTAYLFIIGEQPKDFDTSLYVYILVNGVLLLFAYPLLWILEKSFGFVSDVTLVELTNINHPLLQRMTEVAPGTFQYSMQVANLASEVAKQVGAKPQLVRTGALYHDIGKIERPVFFTENQSGVSPHAHLTPLKSAEVIIAHVTNGLTLAENHNLPPVIRRFIATHHGKGMAKYFYITYCNQHPDEEVDQAPFTYPGPNPETTEEAILMMCDSVEAASRSLPEYTEDSISNLVDRIIDTQVKDGYFHECDITFRQISIAKNVLKERLKNIYHTRITYPELNTPSNTPAPSTR